MSLTNSLKTFFCYEYKDSSNITCKENTNFFEREGYVVLRNVLSKQTIELLKIQIKMKESVSCLKKGVKESDFVFNDTQIKECFSIYGKMDFLLPLLQKQIETEIKKELYPTYSYARIYYQNSTLMPHTDRESCEYSASLCIQNDNVPWELWLKNRRGEDASIVLEEGDMLVYKGDELTHWRNKYEGNSHIQIFLHYVDKNGKYANFKFDKRQLLGI